MHVFGHTHTKGVVEIAQEYVKSVGSPGTYVKRRYVIVCGAYMKTGSNTEDVTWAQRMGFPLRAIGNMKTVVTPSSDKPGLDIQVIT